MTADPIGLALSGSGLKASLFHIGLLARLAELDLLRRVDAISASGGGAVIAAFYHLHLKRALDAEGDIDSDRLIRMVATLERDFLAVVQTDLRARLFENPFANLKRVRAHYSGATRLGNLLDRRLFRPVWDGDQDRPIEMRDLAIHPRGDRDFNPVTDNRNRFCKAPVLIINATNLRTGRAWRFDAERMGEPAAGPAIRRLSKVPLLAQSPYRRLPEAYAGMALGHAVAASMAMPDHVEALRLHRLYPDPERRSPFLDIRLGDGGRADALATDALLERGCMRLIVSDASGSETRIDGPSDRTQALQLAALEANRPGGVVLVHMLSEIEAIEVKPFGPIRRGHVVEDRNDNDVTSYGVERRLQKLIAGMRADLDAPSDIEAMSLMADGYLIAKRAFQRHHQTGQGWAGNPSLAPKTWCFTAVIEALRKPSKALVRNVKTARLPAFRGPRLALSQAFMVGFLALAAALTLIALGAFWSAIRPAAGADRLWILTTMGLLALAAWLAGRHFGDRRQMLPTTKRANRFVGAIDNIRTIAMAFPRSLGARFQRRASRAFLEAGQLENVGIKPIAPEEPIDKTPSRLEPATYVEDKAA